MMRPRTKTQTLLPAIAAVLAMLLIGASPALAQAAKTQAGAAEASAHGRAKKDNGEAKRLPPAQTTDHTIDLPGRSLRFKATAGAIPLFDGDGNLQADVAYTAFVLAGDNPAARPVTFLFNGGPGAASAYLAIGAVGPWRLPLEKVAPSVQSPLVSNAETWLDFTDLVFIDPPGTGYSLVSSDGARKNLWSIDGDAEALAVVIRKWIEQAGRQGSAKFLVGESYGGFRAPKIARKLQQSEGVGIRGLVLLSPVLDFATFGQRQHLPMSWVSLLPSMAAVELDAKGKFDRSALREVEQYAAGDYLRDLMKGSRDAAAVERITARLAPMIGLDPALVRRLAGRIDTGTFQREFYRGRGLVGSAYDPVVTAFDPQPNSLRSQFPDPMLDAMRAPLTSAMSELYRRVLHWEVDKPYRLLDGEASRHWDWGRGRAAPEAVDDLRTIVADDPRLRVLVAHGATDLVTPYFANQMLIEQLTVFGSADRVTLSVYNGGHMFYSRDGSRSALRHDAEAMYRSALEPVRE